jgi:hypothetical protein
MNLLARILSHGFALAVVALIAIALMNRGDLFPEWKLPDFLVIEDKSDAGTDAPAGTVEEPAPSESVAVSPDAGVMAPADTSAEAVAEDVVTPEEVTPAEVTLEEVTPAEVTPAEVTPAEVTPEEVTPAEAPVADDAIDSALAVDPDTGAGEVDAVQEASPEESAHELVDGSQETDGAVSSGALESTPDETEASDVQAEEAVDQTDQRGQYGGAQDDASSVTSTATEVVNEDLEISAPEVVVSPPAAEQVVDPAPTPLASEMPPAAVPDDTGKKSTYELLATAREAYWLHDYERAEKYYQQLIQADPDNPDGYGELGNMHFAQGQWEPAATAYYEAGVRLVKTGMLVQARQLVDVIRGLNGTQADDLERQIEAVN